MGTWIDTIWCLTCWRLCPKHHHCAATPSERADPKGRQR
jgi:hypothetical protein